MPEIQGIITEIPVVELTSKVLEKKHAGCRMVQACAIALPEGYDLLYSFSDPENNMETFKINIGFEDEVLSISNIFAPAFLYENEMKELFGVKIKMISLDYNNKLYRIKVKTPFKSKGDVK